MGAKGWAGFWMAAALAACASVFVVSGVASGAGEGPVSVEVGEEPIVFQFGALPKRLAPSEPTPSELFVEASFYPRDTSAPGPREGVFELDRGIDIDLAGRTGSIVGQGTFEFFDLAGTGEALLRHGSMTLHVGTVGGRAGVLRARMGRGVGFGDAEIRIEVLPVDDGRFGTELRLTVPATLDDRIRLTKIAFKLGDRDAHDPGRREIVTARCRNGELKGRGTIVLADGSEQNSEATRACTPSPALAPRL